jgi:hypothetical protein
VAVQPLVHEAAPDPVEQLLEFGPELAAAAAAID